MNENNKAALVTGGAIRVGRAISLALAKDGYDVALHYNSSHNDACAVKSEIENLGCKCVLFQRNLAADFSGLVADVHAEFSELNLLVNNASIFEPHKFLETSESAFDDHMNINFKAPFFLTQEFAKICKNGNVINILDTFITKHSHSYFTYLASKKVFAEFTKMAAKELAPDIRVNAIAPGTILPATGFDEEYIKAKEQNLPMGKIASVEDVTNTMIDILHNKSLTGQIIFVDGGESLQ